MIDFDFLGGRGVSFQPAGAGNHCLLFTHCSPAPVRPADPVEFLAAYLIKNNPKSFQGYGPDGGQA